MGEQHYGSTQTIKDANLADLAFGHRFVSGQQQMEYLLEFLNVFVGFKSSLDLDRIDHGYQRMLRLGLRRFVFGVGEGEKPEDEVYAGDIEALRALEEKLRSKVEMPGFRRKDEDSLEILRNLFRSLTGVERSRSWYAKSLFPVSESVLWWEGLRPKAQAKLKAPNPSAWHDGIDPDAGFSVGARNFFGRGGEMVFLMLAIGCRGDKHLRARLEHGLTRLLSQHQALSKLAAIIEATWQEVKVERKWAGEGMQVREDKTGPFFLGYIWEGQEPLFGQFAHDVDNLLNGSLDSLEQTEALMHLIGFYVILYFYRRATSLTDRGAGQPVTIFVDALERPGVLRQVSIQSFQRNHEKLTAAAEEMLVQRLLEAGCAGVVDPKDVLTSALPEMAKHWIGKPSPQQKPETKLSPRVESILNRRENPATIRSSQVDLMVEVLFTYIMETLGLEKDFKKQFLATHLGLAKRMRLAVPMTGSGQRYSLNGGLLKALVLAAVPVEERQMEFTVFVKRLFDRYGIVVGPDQVGLAASWLREVDVNHQYFQENLDAFRVKLRTAGLLKEYSDATALVVNKAARTKGGAR